MYWMLTQVKTLRFKELMPLYLELYAILLAFYKISNPSTQNMTVNVY